MNKTVFLGLLAIMLAFGFMGCDDNKSDSGGGTLTITNISSMYDNNYAYFIADTADGGELWGVESIGMSSIKLVQIKNGSVALSMWKIEYSGMWSRYSGNDAITNSRLLIFSSSTADGDYLTEINLGAVTFSNGNAAISAP